MNSIDFRFTCAAETCDNDFVKRAPAEYYARNYAVSEGWVRLSGGYKMYCPEHREIGILFNMANILEKKEKDGG